MAARQFTGAEWEAINAKLEADPKRYGLPQREYGSVLLGSFNIRKMGSSRNRSPDTWEFLAKICRSFDLIAVQEVMDDLSGLRRVMSLLGPDYDLVVSDQTGVFPGERGVGERLGFIYRWNVVERMEVATDITYDRSKVINSIATDYEAFTGVMDKYAPRYVRHVAKILANQRSTKPKLHLPIFLSFIRQPFCVSFRIAGHPDTKPYEIMVVNAHLYFGDYISDRRQEFNALTEWILMRLKTKTKAYYPNFILMGDLNLDFDNPRTDRNRIETQIKKFNSGLNGPNVNFPFLDPHPTKNAVFRTNARLSETFDQIGFFSHDDRLPTHADHAMMGSSPQGPDYGVFEFGNLFSEAILDRPYLDLTKDEAADFVARFEYKVSDHMPLWVRLPLPVK